MSSIAIPFQVQKANTLDDNSSPAPTRALSQRTRRHPTSLDVNNSEKCLLHRATARFGLPKTVKSAKSHHGAMDDNMLPAIAGLWLAILFITDTKQLQHLTRASRKGRQAIGNIVQSRKANCQRSTTVSCSMGNIASKIKYRSIFQSLTRLYNPAAAHRSTIHVMPGVYHIRLHPVVRPVAGPPSINQHRHSVPTASS